MDCYRLLVGDDFERLQSVGQQLSELEVPEENDADLSGDIDILLPRRALPRVRSMTERHR